jgi:hypothetical protein
VVKVILTGGADFFLTDSPAAGLAAWREGREPPDELFFLSVRDDLEEEDVPSLFCPLALSLSLLPELPEIVAGLVRLFFCIAGG